MAVDLTKLKENLEQKQKASHDKKEDHSSSSVATPARLKARRWCGAREDHFEDKVCFSQQAAFTMMNESLRVGEGLETGGVLIGPKTEKGFVADVIPSTSHAERQAATYFQSKRDVKTMNRELRRAQARGLDFVGYWHKHPSGLCVLSNGDLGTSKGILLNPAYDIDNNLIMVIVTATRDPKKLPIFAYRVSLNKRGRVVVKELGVTILPDVSKGEHVQRSTKPSNIEGVRNGKDDDSRHGSEGVRGNEDGRNRPGDNEPGDNSTLRDKKRGVVSHHLKAYEERS